MSIADEKSALRAQALARRMSHDPAAGADLTRVVLRDQLIPEGAAVAGVWPLHGEMDLRPLLGALHEMGHSILLPETPRRGLPLIFRVWTPGCTMIRERFGTYRPDGSVATPDVIFVPLLAFDLDGNRIGYGGGYYDITLRGLPDRLAVGYGYEAQRVPRVPAEPHDYPLKLVVTEAGLHRIHLPPG